MTLEEDAERNIWFGSDIGVVKYRRATDDFERLNHQGQLFDRKIMTIREDDKKSIWITTINDGIYVYNPMEKNFQHFTKKDGLISDAFLYGSGLYDHAKKNNVFRHR